MKISQEKSLQEEYLGRVNQVQDYIEGHLEEEFSLAKLSKIANFSPYHFHRIFYAMTHETLFQYIQRIRAEKAAFLLMAHEKTPITQIAFECGFSTQASFAKAFKKHFNMSASRLRRLARQQEKPEDILKSNMGKVFQASVCYNSTIRSEQELNRSNGEYIPYEVEVKEIPQMKAIYIRHRGPYKKDEALFERLFNKLNHWADQQRLIETKNTKWLTLYHDTADITEVDKLRISVCMTVEKETAVFGEIGSLTIPGGKYAVGHFEISANQYQEAWNTMFAQWLPQSRYQPDDRLCFELYPALGSTQSSKQVVHIYIPVKPL